MTPEETAFFQLVDEYSRKHHQCFVSEMFPTKDESEYTLCFRPLRANLESANRFNCQYLRVTGGEVRAVGRGGQLGRLLIDKLQSELAGLQGSEQ